MNQPVNQPPVPEQILQIIMNFWSSRAVYIFAKLGIPDLLKSGPKTVEELAADTKMHAPSLYRVLRALASIGFVSATADGRFGQTPLSEILVTDAPGSLRWFTISELGQEHYPAWGNLMHSVKTGEIAFDNFFAADVWKYFEQNPEDAAVFNNSMSGITAATNEEILAVYDFSPFGTVVDVGGGHGGLITSILKANPKLKGILLDAPQVIEGARPKIEAAGLADRCEIVASDFFKAVPAGGDAYVMKWIIHDWDDDRAITILKNCRDQMSPDARVIIVDCVVPENNEPDFSKFFDLNMMVMTGGKERTEKEFAQLLNAAGFKLRRVIPTKVGTSIVEGEPA
ncbi:MAG TPA: methyltransferase [Pyrinomonadaceae bacterium]|nr:methyltransferase [Pyrinomonadaceae bacterium]